MTDPLFNIKVRDSGVNRLGPLSSSNAPQFRPLGNGSTGGYPWAPYDILRAADLNAAISNALPANGALLPTSKEGLAPGTYWRNGDFVCIA